MIELAADEGPAGIAREMVPKLVGETTKQLQPDLLEAVRRLIVMNSAEGISTALGALRDRPDSSPLLAAIDFPTLIIAGDEDAIIPVTEAQTMPGVPDRRLSYFRARASVESQNRSAGARADHWLGGVWSFK
jgi:3-oxoadipate enol-lactonase